MAGAEQAMHEHGHQLREVKLVSEKKAIARWKASELAAPARLSLTRGSGTLGPWRTRRLRPECWTQTATTTS